MKEGDRELVAVLFRHGHSQWNLENRLTGWTEIPLTQVGLDAARVAGRRLLVVSHGNARRALVMHLDRITPEVMERVEIPFGVPLVYRFAPDLTLLGRDWLA